VNGASLGGVLEHHPLMAVPILFGGGVLTSLTPCVYPMIPITVAVVGGTVTHDVESTPHRRVVALTLAYAVGVAATYASLGVLAGITGTVFGGISTNPWGSGILANLLVVFALMLLDVIPVPMPEGLLRRAAALRSGGRVIGAVGMGAASGVVAAPCGAPVMATVLTWITTTRSAVLGFCYLLSFSLGMSALVVVAGIAAGSLARLPRPGPWMVWIKRALAVLTLACAEYYLVHMGGLLP
jgi:cytochrome c-type biogenesis protein